MSWFSILPNAWIVLETWLIRTFLLLGIITIGPWAILVVYDLLLYIFRVTTYEVPYVGGRARGRQRPRAPSLSERPDGHRRTFSLGGPIANGTEGEERDGLRARSVEQSEKVRSQVNGDT